MVLMMKNETLSTKILDHKKKEKQTNTQTNKQTNKQKPNKYYH